MRNFLLIKCFTSCFALLSCIAYAQNGGVSINPTNAPADHSAMLDVSSPSAPYLGMLIPRMSTANRTLIVSPATGLQIFNTDCGVNEYYTGTCWISLGQNLRSPAPITCSGTTDLCANDSRTFSTSAVNGATSFGWTVPAGATITSGQGTTSITVTFGNNSGEVCVTADNACETSPARCMDIHIISQSLPAISNNSPICEGTTLSFSSTTLPAVYSFSWTGPNGFASNQQNPSIPNASPIVSGTYFLSVIFSGCSSSPLPTSAIVYGTPTIPVVGASPNPACVGGTLNLTANTIIGASYNWTGPNGFSSTVQNPSVSNMQTNQAGTYNVTATVNGCISAAGSVNVSISSVVSTFSPSFGSTNNPLTFTPTTSGATYSWTFASGSPASSTAQNPSVTWSSTGTYNVTLIVIQNGCSSSTTNSVAIQNQVVIGDSYQGGKVAYILQPGDPGYDSNAQHGLIAAPSDQGIGILWGCQGSAISGADGSAIGTGNQNTIDIITGCPTVGIAAELCGNLVLGGYSDWYLPSIDELSKLFDNRVAIGNFGTTTSDVYWSSTEYNDGNAWGYYFYSGYAISNWFFKNYNINVRAVRSF